MRAPLPPEHVILFHLPKTGGLTMRQAFRTEWPVATWTPRVAQPDGKYERFVREEIDEFPLSADGNAPAVRRWQEEAERTTAVRIFMGHFWYGIHERLPGPSRQVTIVRNPVDRVLSVYAHRRATQGLRVPLDRYLATERDFEISNAQTRRLAAGGLHEGDVTETMYDDAVDHALEHFAAIGTTERYDETFIAIANAIAWASPAYARTNDSVNRPQRAHLSRPQLDRLVERNQFDARLHAFASEQLDKALVGVDVPAALAGLRRRNRVLPYRIKATQVRSKLTRAARRLPR